MRYHTPDAGEWIRPRLKRYFMKCCDCGLVHIMNFKIKKIGKNRRIIMFQAFRKDNK